MRSRTGCFHCIVAESFVLGFNVGGVSYQIPSAALLCPWRRLSEVSGHTPRGFLFLPSLLTLGRVSCGPAPSLALFLAHISSSRDSAEQSGPSATRPPVICSLSHSQKRSGILEFRQSEGNEVALLEIDQSLQSPEPDSLFFLSS